MSHEEVNNYPFVWETDLDFNNLPSSICCNYELHEPFINLTGWCRVTITHQEQHLMVRSIWRSHQALHRSAQVRLLVWRVAVGCRRQTGVPSRSQEQCVCFIKSCMLTLVALMVKNLSAMQETWVRSLGWEKSPGEGNGYPLQYSRLGNPLNREAWWPTQSMGWQRVRHDWETNTWLNI